MSLSKFDRSVTRSPRTGSTSPRTNPSYQTRWQKQAQRALAKAKRGGHPDRRERRLIARYKQWQAEQRQQVQQSPLEPKAA